MSSSGRVLKLLSIPDIGHSPVFKRPKNRKLSKPASASGIPTVVHAVNVSEPQNAFEAQILRHEASDKHAQRQNARE